ncbi:MAG: SpoIIE family protein phosphatase [Clostridia bacterium]|nr:SpoIIE family protein phosphatase [Clostridia bacterium]
MKASVKMRSWLLPKEKVITAATCALLGGVISWGPLLGRAGYFALPLLSALSSWQSCASATLGAIASSLTLSDGGVYAASALGVFILRLFLGAFLGGDGSESSAKKSSSAATPKRVFMYIRRTANLSFKESIFMRMAIALTAVLIYGGVTCAVGGYHSRDLISAAIGATLSPLLVYFYRSSADENGSITAREIGMCAIAATAVLSLGSEFSPWDLSIPAAFVITVVAACLKGMTGGIVYGIVCGAVGGTVLSPMYAISAAVARLLLPFSPAVSVTGACLAGCLWSVYASGISAMSQVVPRLIITSALLAPILSAPWVKSRFYALKKDGLAAADSTASYMLRRESSRRMTGLSGTMRELSGVLYRLSDRITAPSSDELCRLVDGVFDDACSACGMKSACFGTEATRTSEMQMKMALALKRDGRASSSAVPPSIAGRCYSMSEIIDRINSRYATLISEAKLYDRTSVVASDYEVMAEMLKENAEYDTDEYELDRDSTARLLSAIDIKLPCDSIGVYGSRVKKVIARGVNVAQELPDGDVIREALSDAVGISLADPTFEIAGQNVIMRLDAVPLFSARCGRASVAASCVGGVTGKSGTHSETKIFSHGSKRGMGKTASEQCGDVISAFMTDDGRFFMLISDGMGSGSEAALTSGICAVFIEKLLKAGSSMDTSLKMLNSMLRVRGMEVSATVDLMELDLMNGCARFVKSGAAPSLVLRDGRLFRLQSKTVPIGIVRALDAELIKFDVRVGDVIVMLSDGVVRSFEECPWLYDLLCEGAERRVDPEKLSRLIVERAIASGSSDDVTAGVVVVEKS